jgi:hypothetical protein
MIQIFGLDGNDESGPFSRPSRWKRFTVLALIGVFALLILLERLT